MTKDKDNKISPKLTYKELKQRVEDLEKELSGLNRSETNYKTIFKYSPVAIIIVDTKGKILESNERLLEWLGYKPEELVGKNFTELDFMPAKSKAKVMEKFILRMKGEKVLPYSIDVITKSGKKKVGQIVAKTIKDSDGKIIKDLVMISDISEKHKEQEELYESLKKSWAFFQAIPDLIFIISKDGTYIDFKADHESDLAVPKDQIIGKNIRDSGFSEKYLKLINQNIKKAIKSGDVHTFEYEMSTSQGIGIYECRMVRLNKKELLAIVRDITKHKQIKDELRLKNTVFEASLAANSTADVHGNLTHVNQSFLTTWGYNNEEEVIGKSLSEFFVNSEDLNSVMESLNDTGEWRGEYIARMKNGNTFISQGFASVVRDSSGKVVGYQSTVLDISERKRSEEALRNSEKRYRALFEDNNDAVFIFNLDGSHMEANLKAAEMLGYSVKDLIGKPASYFVAEREKENSIGKIESLLKGEKLPLYERIFRKSDGTEFPGEINVSLVYDNEGNPIHFQSIVRDITKRKQKDLDIERRQKFLESFLNDIPEAIVILDPSHNIVEWNPGAEKMFGYKPSEVIGENIDNLITNQDMLKEAKRFTKRVLAGKVIYPYETIRYRKDGTQVNVILSGSPVKIRGELQGIVAIYIDISMQKKIEEELKKADKLESLAILAGGIAHDFNNILTSILVNIGLFELYKNDTVKLSSKVKNIEAAIFRAKNLTQQLLTFSKGNAPIKNPASIRELLEETVNFSLSGSNVKCKFLISDDLWKVEIDEGQISQVIQNITINGVQAMPEGGTIEVGARNVSKNEIKDLPLKKNRYILMEFKDHGIGIPESHMKNIFDPFFTTKQKGGGLGLATAFSIIKNHDGLITIESKLGKTTTFFIYLPALKMKVEKEEKERKEIISGEGNILLMDDDEMILGATSELLSCIGYNVITAKDGAEAVELYKNAKNSKDPFACVILDLTVPNGLGGRETVKELLKIDPDVKALASSGYSIDAIISEYEKFGFVGAIPKPYVIAELSLLINKILKK